MAAPSPVEAFDAAPLGLRRSVIDTLMTVRLGPGVRGCKTFDPTSVYVEWRS